MAFIHFEKLSLNIANISEVQDANAYAKAHPNNVFNNTAAVVIMCNGTTYPTTDTRHRILELIENARLKEIKATNEYLVTNNY